MGSREEARRYFGTFVACAVAALAVWFVFHGIYASLARAAAAVGYVDTSAKMALAFSYFAMAAGAPILGAAAAWAAVRCAIAWSRAKHE